MHGIGGYGWGLGWGWAIGLIIIILLVWVAVWTVRHNPGITQSGRNSALEILKERYARGEIDRSEFEEKKKDLM